MCAPAPPGQPGRRRRRRSTRPASRGAGHRGVESELMHPYYAAEQGLVDDVIAPSATRGILIKSPAIPRINHVGLPPRKHGNPPPQD
nr:carboxyl transferase domain-containing protein [Streptomyces colonosanans]